MDVTIITGMSGAGRSEAAHVLEDLGFFVIDNLPPELITKVAELARDTDQPRRYALVVDVRAGEFMDALTQALNQLDADGVPTRTLFLDASDDVLVRRFDGTRRRHPLQEANNAIDGVREERVLLAELKGRSDLVIDTSELNVHQLRDRIQNSFEDLVGDGKVQVNIVSFGFKHGLPLDVDLLFDVRFLPNPHWEEKLRPLTGLDQPVADYVMAQPDTTAFLDQLKSLFALVLPAYSRESKAYLTVGIGCTGGRHRSVVITEKLAELLPALGYDASIHHRDVNHG